MLKFHAVRTSADQAAALKIYQSTPDYFKLTHQPAPSMQMIREDADAHPADASEVQKHYGLLLVNGEPVGVLDRLNGYPAPDIVYVGLLLIRADRQRQGLGRRTINGLAKQFRREGYKRLRVAVVADNTAALLFWQQVGFKPVGEGKVKLGKASAQTVTILDRELAD